MQQSRNKAGAGTRKSSEALFPLPRDLGLHLVHFGKKEERKAASLSLGPLKIKGDKRASSSTMFSFSVL